MLRALDLFRRKTGKTDRFKVYLEKRTPVQAGLGGGSSNAATTLFAANQVGVGVVGEPLLLLPLRVDSCTYIQTYMHVHARRMSAADAGPPRVGR